MRLLLLIAVASVVGARTHVDRAEISKSRTHPSNLGWLFGLGRKRVGVHEKVGPSVICESEECQVIAKVLKDSMDKSVDPCSDFYEYACGKWAQNNPIPEGKSSWSLWEMVQENTIKKVREFLVAPLSSNDMLSLKLAKKWFASCMDEDAMEERGLEPIISILTRTGGWPMIMEPDEWDEYESSWQKVDDHYARLTARNVFHSIEVFDGRAILQLNTTEKIVLLDTPSRPPGSYDLWSDPLGTGDDDSEEDDEDSDVDDEGGKDDDDSHENGPGPKDSKERSSEERGSQERGSEERENEMPKNEDEEEDKNEMEKVVSWRMKLKRAMTKLTKVSGNAKKRGRKTGYGVAHNDETHRKTKKNGKGKHHAAKSQTKSRTKRSVTRRRQEGHVHRRKEENLPWEKINRRVNYKERSKIKVNREDGVKRFEDEENAEDELSFEITTERNSGEDREDSEEKEQEEEEEEENDTEEEEDMLTTIEKYKKYITEVALAIAKARGTEISEESISKDVDDMIDFQQKLTNITMLSYNELDVTDLDSFQEWYDNCTESTATPTNKINWVAKVGDLFDEANVKIDGSLNVTIMDGQYFELLPDLLAETPKRTIINFIHWNFISRMLMATTHRMRYLSRNWLQPREEEESEMEKGIQCVMEADLDDILSFEYVKRHFSDDITKTAMDMIDDIQKEVEYQIKESEWMDEETKESVLEKLIYMDKLVGYPDWYKNETAVKYRLRGLTVGLSYFENLLSALRYRTWKELRLLVQDNKNEESWLINPLVVNAFFMPDENSIIVTAADFQSPFFAFGRPNTLNYGIIGFIMAHEVNHGFDDSGILYDKKGEAMEWLTEMSRAYEKRAECFIDQFDSYTLVKDSNLTIEDYGNQTIGENIADTMGLQAVYRAYLRRERECGKPEAMLPGLEEFTNNQLFFLSFANLWCEVESEDKEEIVRSAKYDAHSTGRLRVIGSVSNSEDFAKAYNCPVGSPMNPEKKCNIWK